MSENPLVAENEGTSGGAGSAWASDILNIKSDIEQGAGWTAAVDGTLSGLDVLMSLANPFGSLISNGVGWLLEHIPGIKEVWDKLSGDAAAIEQISKTWDNISSSLGTTASTYATASNEIEQWTGKAADSYRNIATGYEAALGAASSDAEGLSVVVELIGGLVSGCKDVIYGLISEFIEFTVIPAILGAIATSWCTFGGSIAAAITYIEIQAEITAGQITVKITKVTEEIIEVSERGEKVIKKTIELTEKLEKIEKSVEKGGTAAQRTAKDLAKGTTRGEVEGTRQRTKKADGVGGDGDGESGDDGSGESSRTPAEAGAR